MRRVLFLMTLVAALVMLGGSQAFAQAAAAPASWSVTDCQGCHEKALGPGFTHTKHASLDQSCAKCHRDVGEHAKAQMAGEKGKTPSVKNLKASDINSTCLSCHEKATQASYLSGMHARRNVPCTDCHSVHSSVSPKAQLKTRTDTETCVTCHKSMRAKSMRTSHHPVREGKMGCSSCHNPHEGDRPNMIKAESVNELCYKCHTDKRGPFLYEHAPVREDCVSCHEPHGSNHKPLLTQKLPNVCWNCHLTGSGHFGSGDKLNTEQGIFPPVAPTGAPSGYPLPGSRFIEKSCKNCHQMIHGSNSPSGAFFLR